MQAYTGLTLKWLRITEPEGKAGMQFGNVRPLRRKRSVRIGFATVRQAGTTNTESRCNEIADAIGQRAKIGWRWVSVVEHRGYCSHEKMRRLFYLSVYKFIREILSHEFNKKEEKRDEHYYIALSPKMTNLAFDLSATSNL